MECAESMCKADEAREVKLLCRCRGPFKEHTPKPYIGGEFCRQSM